MTRITRQGARSAAILFTTAPLGRPHPQGHDMLRRIATAVLALTLMLGVTTALSGTSVAAERTPAQAKCEKARAKVAITKARVVKLRQRGARPVRVRAARKVVRVARRAAVRACRAPAPKPIPAPKPRLGGTVIVGDSMTVNATSSLRALRPDVTIDALWGRGVTQLPVRIRALKAAYDFAPEVVVIALGTNEQTGWGKASYLASIDLLPAGTRVVFVNTWRPQAGIGTPQDGSLYSGWMAEIAAERPRTALADWRAAASAKPELTYDGLHQTVGEGTDTWAGLVVSAVDAVRSMA